MMMPGTFEFFTGGGETFDPRVAIWGVEDVVVVGEGGIANHVVILLRSGGRESDYDIDEMLAASSLGRDM